MWLSLTLVKSPTVVTSGNKRLSIHIQDDQKDDLRYKLTKFMKWIPLGLYDEWCTETWVTAFKRRNMFARLHVFPDEELPQDILDNLSFVIPSPRLVPKGIDDYTQEEIDNFPRVWQPADDFLIRWWQTLHSRFLLHILLFIHLCFVLLPNKVTWRQGLFRNTWAITFIQRLHLCPEWRGRRVMDLLTECYWFIKRLTNCVPKNGFSKFGIDETHCKQDMRLLWRYSYAFPVPRNAEILYKFRTTLWNKKDLPHTLHCYLS